MWKVCDLRMDSISTVRLLFLLFLLLHSALPDSDPFDYLQNLQFDDHNAPGEPLSPEDFDNAEKIEVDSSSNDDHVDDPIEIAGEFEGDIIIEQALLSQLQSESEKNAIKDKELKWVGGTVPYLISSSFDGRERSIIAAAILEYHRRTCIRFEPRTHQKDYIFIDKGEGCSSRVGRQGGYQRVTLGYGCVRAPGIPMHELMHVVGFWHEHSRYDRDNYVTVYYENIKPGMEHNFRKYRWSYIQHLGVQYDTGSIMHYNSYAFSKDRKRKKTIVPKDPNVQIGQRRNLSERDILKINRLYKCGEHVQPVTPTPLPSKPSECSDSHEHCKRWADMGECNRNPTWMHVNCKLSCKQCEKQCNDSNKHCSAWAKRGECHKNPGYMNSYCKKSCKRCENSQNIPPSSGANNKCTDKEKHCSTWASRGECRKNPRYMLKNCPKSCRQCKNTVLVVSEEESETEETGKPEEEQEKQQLNSTYFLKKFYMPY